MTANKPWYQDREVLLARAEQLVAGLENVFTSDPRFKALTEYEDYSRARLVFESNLIEGAGENFGNTRRIIEEHFPRIPAEPNEYRNYLIKTGKVRQVFTEAGLKNLIQIIKAEGANSTEVTPSVGYGDRSRSYKEVAQHYRAVDQARLFAIRYGRNRFLIGIRDLARDKIKGAHIKDGLRKLIDEFLQEARRKRIKKFGLLNETKLCFMHRTISSGLLDENCKSKPGQYRKEPVFLDGIDISFPPPSLVKPAMDRFYDSVKKELDGERSFSDIIKAAAKISYDFVAIHPFPDFNGRLSRIIMNMVLWTLAPQYSLCISLRRNAKNKHRYFYALRKANRGDLRPLEALIALEIVNTIEELNSHFTAAGLEPVG